MSATVAEVTQLADRACILIVTTKRCRATNPKRCYPKSFHVFRWFGGPRAPAGTRCQCGLLWWEKKSCNGSK